MKARDNQSTITYKNWPKIILHLLFTEMASTYKGMKEKVSHGRNFSIHSCGRISDSVCIAVGQGEAVQTTGDVVKWM